MTPPAQSAGVIVQTCCAECGAALDAGSLCTYGCEYDAIEGPRTLVERRWVPEAERDQLREAARDLIAAYMDGRGIDRYVARLEDLTGGQ